MLNMLKKIRTNIIQSIGKSSLWRLARKSPGLSLIFAMILTTTLVLFSIGVTQFVLDSTRNSRNVMESSIAYYAAEAGLEEALFVNKLLKDADKALGADVEGSGSLTLVGNNTAEFEYRILGTTKATLPTDNKDKHIIPIPWTGNVPWTGPGSTPHVGGCDPANPPVTGGTFGFTYQTNFNGDMGKVEDAKVVDHPCNWNRLAVGEKASIPLFGIDSSGVPQSFTEFTLRLRTPCAFGDEMCPSGNRLELNCFDKGEIVCENGDYLEDQYQKGEVFIAWQIDTKDANYIMPNTEIYKSGGTYHDNNSELFEGRINRIKNITNSNFVLLDESDLTERSYESCAKGWCSITELLSNNIIKIKEPVLQLSVVGELIGCQWYNGDGTSCSYDYNSPTGASPQEISKIPYIEYQVTFPAGKGIAPISPANVITSTGKYGAFSQSIQVQVPHDSTGIEYVIQQ